jgi:hypothetical protein
MSECRKRTLCLYAHVMSTVTEYDSDNSSNETIAFDGSNMKEEGYILIPRPVLIVFTGEEDGAYEIPASQCIPLPDCMPVDMDAEDENEADIVKGVLNKARCWMSKEDNFYDGEDVCIRTGCTHPRLTLFFIQVLEG